VARAAALAAALAVSLLAVSGAGGAATQQTPKRGGTVVMGTLREPACINAYLERCHANSPPAGYLMSVALRGAFRAGPGLTLLPDLVSKVDYTKRPPFTFTYRIRPNARWSDRVPITARDFVFTHKALRSVRSELAEVDRALFDRVRSVRAIDPKTFRVVLNSRFSGWRGLFRNVLPAHALRGEDFSKVWLDSIHNPQTGSPIASGPFLIERWDRGRAISFRRNPQYWGAHRAYLDRLVFRFCRQCEGAELVEWLRAGDLDLATGPFLTAEQVVELRRVSGVTVLAEPGASWEHLDLRLGPGGHPALRSGTRGGKLVRRALAYGIDRVAIARTLFTAIDPRYPPTQSSVFLPYDMHYQPNWDVYRYRPDHARRLLEQAGCRRGDDGIYSCAGTRLSLRFVTTAGARTRERILALVQPQLRRAGIEVVPVFSPSSTVFNQTLPSGAFDGVLFAWVRTAFDDPGELAHLYRCGGSQNHMEYCQRLVTRDLDQARRILEPTQQARVLNRVDALLAKDVPVIPLVQGPVVAAFRRSVRGVVLTGHTDPFVNAENWWLAQSR
jgi:peptide/nickel transport system substrate-binding protein